MGGCYGGDLHSAFSGRCRVGNGPAGTTRRDRGRCQTWPAGFTTVPSCCRTATPARPTSCTRWQRASTKYGPPAETHACYRETAHDIRAHDDERCEDEDHVWITKSVASICCRGCGEWSIRRQTFKRFPGEPQEFAEVNISIDPPRSWRRLAGWPDRLDRMAPNIVALPRKVCQSANDRQARLLRHRDQRS